MSTLTKQSPKIEVQAATMAELVTFYNAETGKSIKKFETRAKGVEKCLGLLAKDSSLVADLKAAGVLARSTPAKKPVPTTAMGQLAKTVVATATKTPEPTKSQAKRLAAQKPTGVRPSPRAAFSVEDKITVVHKGDNPKRGTAADRYDLYRNGMTVAAYIAAGGQRRDVVWDQKQGWIKVGA